MQRLPGVALWRPRDEDSDGTRRVQLMQQRVQASRVVGRVRRRDGARDDLRAAIEQGTRRRQHRQAFTAQRVDARGQRALVDEFERRARPATD